MPDIVEQLRDHLRVIEAYPKETRATDMAGFVQSVRIAIDEIERLRAALHTIADFAPGHGDVCEIIAQRARDALRESQHEPG